MVKSETVTFENILINHDVKDIRSLEFFFEKAEGLQMLFYTKHWFSK